MGETDDPMQTDTVTAPDVVADKDTKDTNETTLPNPTVAVTETTEPPTVSIASNDNVNDKIIGDNSATTTAEGQVQEQTDTVAVGVPTAEVPQVAAEGAPIDTAPSPAPAPAPTPAAAAPIANADDDKAPGGAEAVVPPAVAPPAVAVSTNTVTSASTTTQATTPTTTNASTPTPTPTTTNTAVTTDQDANADKKRPASGDAAAANPPPAKKHLLQQQIQQQLQQQLQAQLQAAASRGHQANITPEQIQQQAQAMVQAAAQAQAVVAAAKSRGDGLVRQNHFTRATIVLWCLHPSNETNYTHTIMSLSCLSETRFNYPRCP